MLDEALLEQVVDSCDLVVLVAIQTLRCIVFFETISFKVAKKRGLDWNFVLSYDKSLTFTNRLICLVPRMLLDLRRSQPLVRVSF